MPAISFPTAISIPPRTDYGLTPWVDDNGKSWLWVASKLRWEPVAETVVGATGPAGSDANVTNANVNTAIATNTSATRTALGLGTADSPIFAGITTTTFNVLTGGSIAVRQSGAGPAGNRSGLIFDSGTGTQVYLTGSIRFGPSAVDVGGGADTLLSRLSAGVVGVQGITATVTDVEASTVGKGLIVKSPNGNRWRLTPDNSGNSVWTAL